MLNVLQTKPLDTDTITIKDESGAPAALFLYVSLHKRSLMSHCGHGTILPKKPLSYSLEVARRGRVGSIAFPPKPRALLLSKGWRESRGAAEMRPIISMQCATNHQVKLLGIS